MKLIKLTVVGTGKPIYINPHHIVSFNEEVRELKWAQDKSYCGTTVIGFTDEDIVHVVESPEMVAEMIEKAVKWE